MPTERSLVRLARDAMRQWPALTLVLALVVGFEWLSERRQLRFDERLNFRDAALQILTEKTFLHISASTRALQRLADRLHVDGWDDTAKASTDSGG